MNRLEIEFEVAKNEFLDKFYEKRKEEIHKFYDELDKNRLDVKLQAILDKIKETEDYLLFFHGFMDKMRARCDEHTDFMAMCAAWHAFEKEEAAKKRQKIRHDLLFFIIVILPLMVRRPQHHKNYDDFVRRAKDQIKIEIKSNLEDVTTTSSAPSIGM